MEYPYDEPSITLKDPGDTVCGNDELGNHGELVKDDSGCHGPVENSGSPKADFSQRPKVMRALFYGNGLRSDELTTRMWSLGIECPLNGSSIAGSVTFEPPCRMIGGVHNWASTWIGAFTYSWSTISGAVRSVGRYCSIASQVTFGEHEHPTACLTTSSFIYDPGWMWGEFAAANGRRHSPQTPVHDGRDLGITIGNDVWIGVGAYIKSGVRLGDGCIVGAKAVVTKDVPPYAIVVGNPGRISRYRFSPETIEALLALQWWRHSFDSLDGVRLDDVPAAIEHVKQLDSRKSVSVYLPACLQLLSGPAMEAVTRTGFGPEDASK